VVDTIDIGGLAETVFARPGVIVLTVLGAWLVSRVVRRTVKYLVRRLRSRRVQERLGRVRRRTPSALLDTGTLQVPRATERVEALAAALSSAAGFVVWVVALVLVLDQLDVRLGPLLAGAGLVGVALGFGAQSLIRDLLTGLFFLVEDQFGVGDVIDVGVATGKVEAVTLRATTIRAVDGTAWHTRCGACSRSAPTASRSASSSRPARSNNGASAGCCASTSSAPSTPKASTSPTSRRW
jgi:small conductance mechanosensitive channel